MPGRLAQDGQTAMSGRRTPFWRLACLLFFVPGLALAHLKGDPGVPCFRMLNDRVVEISNPLHGSSFADILDIQLNPNWETEYQLGEPMYVDVRYRIAHCRPYTVFIEPLWGGSKRATPFTSPSPTYEPGEREGVHTGFVGFKPTDARRPMDVLTIEGIRVNIHEYGTGKLLATRDLRIAVSWRAKPQTIAEKETCTNKMAWPAERPVSRDCSNVARFEMSQGFRVADKVDLNRDGTCELLVEVESCRKLNNNTCFKVFAERNNRFREIWQYYNRLLVFDGESAHARLGSTETGPIQNVHRVGIYDSSQERYVTQRQLEPCR